MIFFFLMQTTLIKENVCISCVDDAFGCLGKGVTLLSLLGWLFLLNWWLTQYLSPVHVDEYGHGYPPFFFLKSSFWSRQQKADRVVLEGEIDSDPSSNDSFEPVSPEFHGKEAIRYADGEQTKDWEANNPWGQHSSLLCPKDSFHLTPSTLPSSIPTSCLEKNSFNLFYLISLIFTLNANLDFTKQR